VGEYIVNSEGVFKDVTTEDDKEQKLIRICAWLAVTALTRDAESNDWGRLLRWNDADGKKHEHVLPQSILANGNRAAAAILLAGGLDIASGAKKQDAVIEYIQSQRPKKRVTIASKVGWLRANSVDVYVLPGKTVRPSDCEEEFRYAPTSSNGNHGYEHAYAVRGTIDDWKREVAARCRGNTRLLTNVSASFAAPTLRLLNEDGGGFHNHGPSSRGKTTGIDAAGSVWGGGGKDGFTKSWKTTSNALEQVAAEHNDCCLPLDELGQLEPYEAVKVPYLLGQGTGKARMNVDGGSQPQRKWRTLVLSTGELTFDALARTVGAKTRGGHEVRMINIPADAGKGMGAFEDIHEETDAGKFADALKAAAKENYGAVGRRWLALLVEAPEHYTAKLRKAIAEFEKSNMQGATGEVGRVVHRFAIVAAAGEVATSEKLTGWQRGEASAAVATCLKAWLATRGATGRGHDEEQMIRQIRHFIQSNRSSRFRELPDTALGSIDYTGPIHRLAGYWRCRDGHTTYYFQTEVFRSEVCRDWDYKQVLAALKKAKYLKHDSDRLDKQIKGPRMPRERFYAVKEEILLGDNIDSTKENKSSEAEE
jgi:putative DNA primase/helicase